MPFKETAKNLFRRKSTSKSQSQYQALPDPDRHLLSEPKKHTGDVPVPLFKEGQKFYYVPYTPSDDHITPEPHWIVRVRYDVPTETMRYQLRNEKGSHLQWMGEHSLETLEEEGG
ncbi:hypothetical protein MMC28_009708 [Mycoblastus sanguinarius]|nr:hypothetical protein [Mycoblastus sanguinarius]